MNIQTTQFPKGGIFNAARAEKNWLVCKLVEKARPGGGIKLDKVPQHPQKPRNAAAKTAAALTLKEALDEAENRNKRTGAKKDKDGWHLVGYLPREGSTLVAVDFDHCLNASGDLLYPFDKILSDADVYREVSPSGDGVRVLLPRGEDDFWQDERKFPDTDEGVGFFGSDAKFFTTTFNRLGECAEIKDSHKLRHNVRVMVQGLKQLHESTTSGPKPVAKAAPSTHADDIALPPGVADMFESAGSLSENAHPDHWIMNALQVDEQFAREVVENALTYIDFPAGSRDNGWLSTLFGLRALERNKGLPWLRALVEQWNDRQPHSDTEKDMKDFDNADPCGKARANTVFHHARESGWDEDVWLVRWQDKLNARAAVLTGGPDDGDDSGEVPADDGDVASALAALSRRFTFVMYGGKARVFDKKKDEFCNPQEWSRFDRLPQIPISQGRGLRRVDKRKFWLEHYTQRPEKAEGVVFLPGVPQSSLPDELNLWKGWGIDPINGDWPLLKNHLSTIVCQGETVAYEYLVDVLAWGVQNPDKLCEVAIAIRGAQGTGKSLLSKVMQMIYSARHSFVFADPNLLLGSFTGHLQGKQFLAVEEAFFSGDKRGVSKLKNIITNDVMQIHPKGLEPFSIPNLTRILVTANPDHIIQLEGGDRRWLILETDDSKASDATYFKPLWQEIHNGGAQGFFHYLLSRDLSHFDIHNKPPATGAKNRQIGLSIDGVDAWWMECLKNGSVTSGGSFVVSKEIWESASVKAENRGMADSCVEWLRSHGAFSGITSNMVTRVLRSYGVTKEAGGDRRFLLRSLKDERAAFLNKYGVQSFDDLE